MSEQPQPNLNWYRDLGETYREMAERTAEEPPPEGHEDSARSLSEHYKELSERYFVLDQILSAYAKGDTAAAEQLIKLHEIPLHEAAEARARALGRGET
jgi:hypothetical protein